MRINLFWQLLIGTVLTFLVSAQLMWGLYAIALVREGTIQALCAGEHLIFKHCGERGDGDRGLNMRTVEHVR